MSSVQKKLTKRKSDKESIEDISSGKLKKIDFEFYIICKYLLMYVYY